MAVRRHIGPVMVMMTVMAVNLHLLQRYGIDLVVSIVNPTTRQLLTISVDPVGGSLITSISLWYSLFRNSNRSDARVT